MGGVDAKDQVNLTDENSRIMKVPGGGFDQSYNAQAVVAKGSLLVVTNEVSQAANDKQQLAPMPGKLDTLPEALGGSSRCSPTADTKAQANVERCEAARIEPLIAMGREHHHVGWRRRFAPPLSAAIPLERMAHWLQAPAGRKPYALRKQTPEPVFGIIKSAMAFANFCCADGRTSKASGTW